MLDVTRNSWELRGPSSRPFFLRCSRTLVSTFLDHLVQFLSMSGRAATDITPTSNSDGCSDFFGQVDYPSNRYTDRGGRDLSRFDVPCASVRQPEERASQATDWSSGRQWKQHRSRKPGRRGEEEMLAKLLVFSKFAHLSLIAGVVAVSSMMAGQTKLTSDSCPNTEPAGFADITSAEHRDSDFATSRRGSDLTVDIEPECGTDQTEQPQPSCCGGCDVATGQVDLDFAADTGCRLFGQIVSGKKGAKDSQPPHEDVVRVASFAFATKVPASVTTSHENQIQQVSYEMPATRGADLPCVNAPTCDISVCRNIPVSYDEDRRRSPYERAVDQPVPPAEIHAHNATAQAARTCRLRNRETKEPLATLQIGARVDTAAMSDQEIAAFSHTRPNSQFVNTDPVVRVTRNQYSDAWVVEARNVELPDLIEQLAEYCADPIVCGEDVRGTVSATVSAFSVDEALHRIVTPFGYPLRREGTTLVVGVVSPEPNSAESTIEPDQAEPSVVAEPDVVDRLPPVESPKPVAVVSAIRSNTKNEVYPQDLEIAAEMKQLIQAGDTDAAIRLISRGIVQRPNSAYLFRLLGEAFAFQADFDRAAVALEYSIKLNKYDPATSKTFSEVLAHLGQSQRSKHYAQLARDIHSGVVVAP